AVLGIDLPTGKRVVAAKELHSLLAADHVDLERLGRACLRAAHEKDGCCGLGLGGRHQRLLAPPTRSLIGTQRSSDGLVRKRGPVCDGPSSPRGLGGSAAPPAWRLEDRRRRALPACQASRWGGRGI